MEAKLLNLFLKYSAFSFFLKQKIVKSQSWIATIPVAALLMLSELLFAILSIPLYVLVHPSRLQERGVIFPSVEKTYAPVLTYQIRRKISLAAATAAAGIFALKTIFIAVVSLYLIGVTPLLAATQNWDFTVANEYTFTAGKISVSGGVAQLVDQGGGGSCGGTATACGTFANSGTCSAQSGCTWNTGISSSTTNSAFTSNANGWTYVDWETGNKVNGVWASSGGNPGGNIQITITGQKNITISGYYYQAFTTTAANSTATATFNYSIPTYNAANITSLKLYAFVDSNSSTPTIGTEVWSRDVTSTLGWLTVSNLDVSSKVTSTGTHYLKLVIREILNNNSGSPGTTVAAFDNALLSWTGPAVCSGTATTCNTFINSGACAGQSGCSWTSAPAYPTDRPSITPNTSLAPFGVTAWNSFTETATKGTGEIYYQLSNDDGANWKFWNGAVWATSTTSTASNPANVINANIGSFGVTGGKIKWKAFLASNGTQQISLDNIAIGYTQNNPPAISNVSVLESTTTGYVHINYSLSDAQSDPANLVAYEYSLTGAFAGEQATMTPASDPAHNGVNNLSTSAAGVPHTFVWNARADLGNIYSNSVYIRLRANDGIANGNFATSSAAVVDFMSPIVSSVTAAQSPTSSDVIVGYNLFDNSTNNNNVEIRISSDGGSTWTVPTTSLSGDVGSNVPSGSGKTIIWHAGIDFPNQENNAMVVAVRAKDQYQNQGGYTNSAAFPLDNKAPLVATTADLLAQPHAGDTSVLISGSFTESNPNTNDFYVAVNGGSYGASTGGDSNTAAPSPKNVAVGSALKGSDFISAVKIIHTDDYGHATTNENTIPNTSFKFVKPYLPPAPTISNPGSDSLDVTIVKNPAEADGLEYAIFENSQSLYVQSDGSLGATPYWQSIGTAHVIGLSQPISQYNFQVKSRNTSDTAHAATSESDLSSGASSNYQSPQIIITSAAQTTNGTKYVIINYSGTDFQNHANSLVKYEYSLNGADWFPMTEKTGVGSSGTNGLNFTSGGAPLNFAWNVSADAPNTENAATYVRLQSNDSVTNSNLSVSSAFVIDTRGPVISNLTAAQNISSSTIAVGYDLADATGSNIKVSLAISDDSGASYTVPTSTASGDLGSSVSAGLHRGITWNAGLNYSNVEKNTMRAKLVALDSFGNIGSSGDSADFAVDTKAPVLTNITAEQQTGSALVLINYTVADTNSSTVSFEVSSDSGNTWTIPTTTYSGDVGSGIASGSHSILWNAVADFPDQELASMQVRMRAFDAFGNAGSPTSSSDFNLNSKVLSISNITATQNLGSKTITIHYNINKNATTSLDISADNGTTWAVPTTTLAGSIGPTVAGNSKTVTWNPGIDFPDADNFSMRIRIRGTDNLGITSPNYESANFSVDTLSPAGLTGVTKFASTTSTVTMNWSAGVLDSHFNHYELWHGANRSDVQNRTSTASKWSTTDDLNLSSISTISTVISGVDLTSNYYVKLWAVDDYGNESTVSDVDIFSPSPVIPSSPAPSSGGGSFAADAIPPSRPILTQPDSPSPDLNILISGLAEADSRIDLYDSGKLVARLTNLADHDGRFAQTFNFEIGAHALSVIAIDSAGNVSEESNLVLVNIEPKTIPPVILSPRNNEVISSAEPVIAGAAAPLANLELTIDNDNLFTLSADANGAWNFRVPTSFALKEGTHTITVRLAGTGSTKEARITITKTSPAIQNVTSGRPVITSPTSSRAIALTTPSAPIIPTSVIQQLNTLTEVPGIPEPKVTNVTPVVQNNSIAFTGTALPNQEVIVYVHSNQALIFRTRADQNGVWSINHSQNTIELSAGEHSVYAVAVDSGAGVKSRPGATAIFTIQKNFWVNILNGLNLPTTSVTFGFLLLTTYWMIRLKKTELVEEEVSA